MTGNILVYVLLFLMTCYVHMTESCSCFPAHPQELFCNSQFVIKALVTSEGRLKNEINNKRFSMKYHSLTILEVFRGKEILQKFISNEEDETNVDEEKQEEYIEANITTPSSQNLCGVQLNYTETYLIFGQIQDDQLQVNTCNFIANWETVTNQVKSGIFGDYDCRCSIETHMNSKETNKINKHQKKDPIKSASSATCYWEMYPDEPVDECALNFLTCRKLVHPMSINDEKEQCVWVEGRDYELCQLTAEVKENHV